MKIHSGSFSSLIEWFKKDDVPYEFICLFVTGGIGDQTLIENIYNNRHVINNITSSRLVVFLFKDCANSYLRFPINSSNSEGVIITGELLWPSADCVDGLMDSSIIEDFRDKGLRDNIVESSQAISKEIIETLGLNGAEAPFVLFLEKQSPQIIPHIIQTHGAADINIVINLFRDIQQLLSAQEEESWGIYREECSVLQAEKRIEDIKHQQQINRKHIETTNNSLQCIREEIQRKRVARKIMQRTTWEARSFKKIRHLKNIILLSLRKEKELRASSLDYRQELERVFNKYERKLKFLSVYENISSFLSKLLRPTKKLNDVLSIEEKIDKIINGN